MPRALLAVASLLLALAGSAVADDPVSLATSFYYYGKRVAAHQQDVAEHVAAETLGERLGPLFVVVNAANRTADDAQTNASRALEDAPGAVDAMVAEANATATGYAELLQYVTEEEQAALDEAVVGLKAQLQRTDDYATRVILYQLSRL